MSDKDLPRSFTAQGDTGVLHTVIRTMGSKGEAEPRCVTARR